MSEGMLRGQGLAQSVHSALCHTATGTSILDSRVLLLPGTDLLPCGGTTAARQLLYLGEEADSTRAAQGMRASLLLPAGNCFILEA